MKRIVAFLDRDGVIDKKAPRHDYIKTWREFEFLPGAINAIKILNQKGYFVIVITNQQGIGKGLFSVETLDEIHKNMQNELKKKDAKIDKIYFCPHLESEKCNCRKPKPGMFLQAIKENNIDIDKSIAIGDSNTDAFAAKAARIKKIYNVTDKINLLSIVLTLD